MLNMNKLFSYIGGRFLLNTIKNIKIFYFLIIKSENRFYKKTVSAHFKTIYNTNHEKKTYIGSPFLLKKIKKEKCFRFLLLKNGLTKHMPPENNGERLLTFPE